MNFADYGKSLGIGGVHTNGQRHHFEAQDIIENTWYDDSASCVVYLYDYYHDDEVDFNTNLHPEKSKTKIPVEVKCIVKTYRSLSKDEVDYHIMFKPSYRCNVPYYKKFFEDTTHACFPVGLYLDKQDEKGVWKKWLVVSEADTNIGDFPTWSILPCNYRYQWMFDGKKQQMWGVERSQNSYNSGVWRDHIFESTENQTKAMMPYNDVTRNLYYNDRLLVTIDLLQPLSWRISKIEPLAHKGVIMYTFKEDEYDANNDYIERDEHGNVIGYWADYYKNSNLPNNDPKSEYNEDNGTYAIIDYSGAEPHIKVNGTYKAVTIAYYNSNELVKNQLPGEWSYWIDDTDASDLVQILSQNDANTIKVKFLGNEEYLGKVLTIRNTRDNIVAEVDLQIVSL